MFNLHSSSNVYTVRHVCDFLNHTVYMYITCKSPMKAQAIIILTHWLQAGLDEPGPFFHFWRHHFWPKLASSMVNFCRRKRSFQWCPGQSDRSYGAWDMHKNAQKVEWKSQSKISGHYTWLLHGQIFLSQWRFLEAFLNCKQTQQKANHCCSKKRRRKRNSEKNISKIKKPKD